MAHPITQLPPSTLPFCLPARTTTSLGFSFGDFGSHHYPLPPLRHEVEPAPIKTRSSYGTEAVPSSSTLKRARRSRSPSSTSSPSHIQSSPILEKFGDSSISRLSPERRIGGNQRVKRLRQTYASLEDASDTSAVDVGLLLSSLPATSHLSILLQLLREQPALHASVLEKIPRPDLRECLAQVDKCLISCKKALGQSAFSGPVSARAWIRAEKEITAFSRTVSTYITFFHSTTFGPLSDWQNRHALLYGLTTRLCHILSLFSPETDNTAVAKPLLELAQHILNKWRAWVKDIASEINVNGGMFSYPAMTLWADNLEALSCYNHNDSPDAVSSDTSTPYSAWSATISPSSQASGNDVIASFRAALAEIRSDFVKDVGWVVGRQHAG